MINLVKLLAPQLSFAGDNYRYRSTTSFSPYGVHRGAGPVVVWNTTRACNLRCRHCYAAALPGRAEDELTTTEALQLIEQLAAYRVPVLLLSGGEPLLRSDLFTLIEEAVRRGIRVTVSSNGTLITPKVAQRLQEAGVSYIGISLDGMEKTNDFFRGEEGAFAATLAGIRACLEAGVKVGLRLTINRANATEIKDVLRLMIEEDIPRICFYHLVYSGRGRSLKEEDLTLPDKRELISELFEQAKVAVGRCTSRGEPVEILTVDNHCDGVYLYLKLREESEERANIVHQLLAGNGGNRSGMAIACIDWQGNVYPDQFTMNHPLGNVRLQPFASIWENDQHPILAGLRRRHRYLKGRCAVCRYLVLCNGNLRARAEAVSGDFWAPDPACYLNDEEVL